jgi:hypothetical protein
MKTSGPPGASSNPGASEPGNWADAKMSGPPGAASPCPPDGICVDAKTSGPPGATSSCPPAGICVDAKTSGPPGAGSLSVGIGILPAERNASAGGAPGNPARGIACDTKFSGFAGASLNFDRSSSEIESLGSARTTLRKPMSPATSSLAGSSTGVRTPS